MQYIRQSGALQRIKTPAGYLAAACVAVGWVRHVRILPLFVDPFPSSHLIS